MNYFTSLLHNHGDFRDSLILEAHMMYRYEMMIHKDLYYNGVNMDQCIPDSSSIYTALRFKSSLSSTEKYKNISIYQVSGYPVENVYL